MRILIFSAHPDDAEFNIGGIVLRLAKAHELTLAVMTDGSAGSYGDSKTRKVEQECAAEMYGATLLWEGLRDCSLQHDNKTVLRVAQIIRDAKPDVIISPHWNLNGDVLEGKVHPEHRIMGELIRDAARYARFNIEGVKGDRHKTPWVLWYMLNEPLTARLAISVDSVAGRLPELWDCHKTQTQLKDGKLKEYLESERKTHAALYPGSGMIEFLDAEKPLPEELVRELFSE